MCVMNTPVSNHVAVDSEQRLIGNQTAASERPVGVEQLRCQSDEYGRLRSSPSRSQHRDNTSRNVHYDERNLSLAPENECPL
jgi:hypothetical protein